jgi:hypothetical protein
MFTKYGDGVSLTLYCYEIQYVKISTAASHVSYSYFFHTLLLWKSSAPAHFSGKKHHAAVVGPFSATHLRAGLVDQVTLHAYLRLGRDLACGPMHHIGVEPRPSHAVTCTSASHFYNRVSVLGFISTNSLQLVCFYHFTLTNSRIFLCTLLRQSKYYGSTLYNTTHYVNHLLCIASTTGMILVDEMRIFLTKDLSSTTGIHICLKLIDSSLLDQ